MKNNKRLAYAALAVAFVLLNVIVFVLPTDKTVTFWIVYSFTALAFALQLPLWDIAFRKTANLKSKFLGLPLISAGITYLILQVIVLLVFTAIPYAENWIAILTCAMVLGVSVLCLIGTTAAKNEISNVEGNVQSKTFFLKALQVDVELLANEEADPNTKKELTKLAEMIRFSDPMSDPQLSAIEQEISAKVAELKTAENKAALIPVLTSLITERNKKAKILK